MENCSAGWCLTSKVSLSFLSKYGAYLDWFTVKLSKSTSKINSNAPYQKEASYNVLVPEYTKTYYREVLPLYF